MELTHVTKSGETLRGPISLIQNNNETKKEFDERVSIAMGAELRLARLHERQTKLQKLLATIGPVKGDLAISAHSVGDELNSLREKIPALDNQRPYLNEYVKKKIDLKKAKELLSILKKRVKLTLTLEIASMTTKICVIAGLIFLFFPPMAPIGFILVGVSLAGSLTIWGGRALFVNKDPFNPQSRTRARQFIRYLSKKIRGNKEKLQTHATALTQLQPSPT